MKTWVKTSLLWFFSQPIALLQCIVHEVSKMCLVLHFMFNCISGKVLVFLAKLPRKGRSLSYVISQSWSTSLFLYSPCSTEGCVVICIVCYLFVSFFISRTRHGYLRINSHQLLWISCLNGTLLISKIIVLCVGVGERVRYLTGAN